MVKSSFSSRFLEHSKNHFDEADDNINLLHDLVHEDVLSSQLELVLLQNGIELHDMVIESNHLLLDHGVKLSHADVLDDFQ